MYGIKDATATKYHSYTVQKIIIENGKVVSATGEFPYDVLVDYTENKVENNIGNNSEINNSTLTITHSKTNIILESEKDIIPNGTILNIEEITLEDKLDKIKNNFSKIESFKAYDISLKSNNTNVQPNGKVKISIPIPEGFDASKLVVYRLEEDGTKIEYQVTATNGYATFETDHFSTYVLGETAEEINETQDKTEKNEDENTTVVKDTKLPQTGEETNSFASWLSIATPLGIFWLCSMLLIEREKKK